ncbi:MAG: TonB-dependent receptor [Ignavibacteria bacterium]|nr:TonB-dependent receptor [Ignavibacteria bacterium]
MNKFLKITFVISLFLFTNLFAQYGKITGSVKDKNTGEPLIGVNITLPGTALGAATDVEGYYVILRVPPGVYSMKASLVGYNATSVSDVRVSINQTSEVNLLMVEQRLTTQEVVVVAEKPVVDKDVSASTSNIAADQFQKLPVASVASVVQLEAGIQSGMNIRGGGSDQTMVMLNGIGMRDERSNTPFSAVSLTAVDEIQVQTGGFNAEYGNIRSGILNVVTKEGNVDKYHVSFVGRYRPAGNKSFEDGPSSKNFYYIRPFVDPAVCWTGTTNGNWSTGMQSTYPTFQGWNNYVLSATSPYAGLTPEAAQRLFLWQHRKDFSIDKPDHDVDMTVSGPLIPVYSRLLGNLRFVLSYRENYTNLLMPFNTDNYYENIIQGKVTSDVGTGMKLTFDGLFARQSGTAVYRDGSSGINTSVYEVANNNFAKGSDGESRIYSTDYWCPASTERWMLGGKFTHAISGSTFYEANFSAFSTSYKKFPGLRRDLTNQYAIIPALVDPNGNYAGYYTNEAPYGYEPLNSITGIGSSMRMGGGGMSYGRDTSKLTNYNLHVDYSTQYNKYHFIKAGIELNYTENKVNNGIADSALPSNNTVYYWQNYPIRGAVYAQDKIEYEGMIANVGLRMDFLDPNTDWYSTTGDYDLAYSANPPSSLDAIKNKKVNTQVYFSPRLGVAFPITVNSKLYFNYGHFMQVSTPDNLFLLRKDLYSGRVAQVSDPSIAMQKTIAYELGYEHGLWNDYHAKIAGYYKDVTNETRLVTYVSSDNKVNYTIPRADLYEDIRGLELTFQKKRGDWVTGFVNYTYQVRTYGYFNYATYYQNTSSERKYIREYIDNKQTKPVAQPYARLNLDVFTPHDDFGPQSISFLLTDWRLNVLASWQAGEYFTWTGGGSTIAGFQNNFQWSDSWGVDLRLSKDFKVDRLNIQVFADIYNALNIKTMSRYYGWTEENFNNYMKSLHLGSGDWDSRFGYINIPGSDKPGDYRDYDVTYTPMKGVTVLDNLNGLDASLLPPKDVIYYEASSGRYVQRDGTNWKDVDPSRMDQIKKDKAYIAMPNMGFFSFLNPRNIYFGIKFSVELF